MERIKSFRLLRWGFGMGIRLSSYKLMTMYEGTVWANLLLYPILGIRLAAYLEIRNLSHCP